MNRTERLNVVLQEAASLNNGPNFIWSDGIQENAPLWGFDAISVQFPSRTEVVPDDNNGANLERVADPLGGPGFWLRHYGDLSKTGSARAQAGVYGDMRPEVNAAADEGCYFEQECYFPEVLSANGDLYSWLNNTFDIHVLDPLTRGNRSFFGIGPKQDGSMLANMAWGGKLYKVNRDLGIMPPVSTVPFPVGRPFKLKVYFKKSVEPTTIKVWFDNDLAMEWVGVINSLPSNTITEYYVKLYGGVQRYPDGQSASPWGKVERYSRNIRIFKQ